MTLKGKQAYNAMRTLSGRVTTRRRGAPPKLSLCSTGGYSLEPTTSPDGAVVGMGESPHEACGAIGVYAPGHDVARIAFYGLFALQHRGQESAGIATTTGRRINIHTSLGLVSQAFRESDLERLEGHIAIGHTRYSTTGANLAQNAQPIISRDGTKELALGHNGNIINALELRKELQNTGFNFSSTTDSEVIAHLLASAPGKNWQEKIGYMMRRLQGAYSLVVMTNDTLLGIRDPNGVRPLCIGKLNGGWILSSESCALDHLGAKYLREVEPGEAVVIDKKGLTSIQCIQERPSPSPCIFENIYFARPDSYVEGRNVYEVRKKIGAELAQEKYVDADIVVPVPDSGVPAAIGYAERAKITFELGIIRNHYVGRTFIEPTDQIRHLGVRLKHNANRGNIEGKRVVLVDDSIVRGTTSEKIVAMVRAAGAKEVHMRISSPPIAHPCFYGIDTPRSEQLLASRMDVDAMAKHIGADSLAFISMDGLYRAVGETKRNSEYPQYCDACFTGEYPIDLTDQNGGPFPAQLSLLAWPFQDHALRTAARPLAGRLPPCG